MASSSSFGFVVDIVSLRSSSSSGFVAIVWLRYRLASASSYGFGISMNAFGLRLNWDFAKIWDFQETQGSYQTEFWIGTRF